MAVIDHSLRCSRLAALALAMTTCAMPLCANAQESQGQEKTEDRSDIVVLGTRHSVDRTLSSDPATERMSQSSRSLEQDVLQAAGTYRLNDALELVSGFSQQNNRGGVLDNFAIAVFWARRTAARNSMSTASSPIAAWSHRVTPPPSSGSRC
ncbi:hypothetical protein GCM10020258_20830 [Sphingomonas yabuuchiae]